MFDFHQLFNVASQIGGLALPGTVLVMIIILIKSRSDLSAVRHQLQLTAARVDVAVANIELVRHATNSLMEESKRAAELLAYAAGVKAGLKQEDLITRAAEEAASLLRMSADRAAAMVQAKAEIVAEELTKGPTASYPTHPPEPILTVRVDGAPVS